MEFTINPNRLTSRITSITMGAETFNDERFLGAMFGMFASTEGGTIHLETTKGTVSLALNPPEEKGEA